MNYELLTANWLHLSTPDLIGIAWYLLSATIDEILGKSYVRVYNLSGRIQSITPLTNDGSQPQQRFFEILNYIKERPNQYLDLIELVYFCLIAGFEGEHHLKADGRQVLDNHIEDLYQIIQKYRYNKPIAYLMKTLYPNWLREITSGYTDCNSCSEFSNCRILNQPDLIGK